LVPLLVCGHSACFNLPAYLGCPLIRGVKGKFIFLFNRSTNSSIAEVLFRYALAILKSIEEKLLRQNDYMSIFSTFRAEVESLSDVKKLTQVSGLGSTAFAKQSLKFKAFFILNMFFPTDPSIVFHTLYSSNYFARLHFMI
jgi:hypothetical protein